MNQAIFEARSVSRRFDAVVALDQVSIGIAAGEVHAVIGENGAGKSTLMNIFCGKLQPSEGELFLDGRPVLFHTPLDAQLAGIAIAPQEINLVPALTVAENILLGAQRTGRLGTIDWTRTRAEAAACLAQLDETIDPGQTVDHLSKAQQQLVQIARAVATSARILIFDEPTAALTDKEAQRLFRFIRTFRAKGGAIFYISHRLDEILELSDRISVLRDGRFITELEPRRTSKDEMVQHMAGRPVQIGHGAGRELGDREVVLEVRGLTRQGEFRDIGFDLHQGEILGVAGLVGSGRTELGKCIFGVTHASAGSIRLFGQPFRAGHPADAIAKGLVYLPEERKQEGIFPLLSITENMAMPAMDRFRRVLGLRFNEMVQEVETYVRNVGIKIGRPEDAITTLSGGNQQKVILARWLMKNSRILILDEPTRGIDVKAKFEIQAFLRDLSGKGLSILYISSELQEVLDVADRILVMHEGQAKGIEPASAATQESLLALAMS
ncbi:sugar ABC transporter ATP-binding protein [Geminicoccus roseus]|uniref:sugar ABC transporter ATP-binding protein n=1 Tax=Geminicoccus roseus TaxID=404900 RepID=UPI0003F88E48|nr:sugar ABC transporter ATP-binding protein [Geminicoccus roseus]